MVTRILTQPSFAHILNNQHICYNPQIRKGVTMLTDDLLKTSEAAKRLGISQGTLRGYADKGMIPVVKLPSGHRRFRASDVQRLREDMGIDPKEESKGDA